MMTAGPYGPRDPGVGPPNRMQGPGGQHQRFSRPVANGRDMQNQGPRGYGQPPPLEVKLIFNRDEVGYLFGFDGVLMKQLCQQTGANVNMTGGECYEYVISISGTLDIIFKAFSLICRKLWDFWTNIVNPGQQRPLTIRLSVPASQCGSIIGKQGSKVKEIRDLTGANIQVGQDSLPESSERCVEITGNGETCLQCVYHICNVFQETPPRSDNIPYIPKPHCGPPRAGGEPMEQWTPVFLCGDKAYIIDGMRAIPAPPEVLRKELSKTPLGGRIAETLTTHGLGGPNSMTPDHMNPLALMAAISSSHRNMGNKPRTSKEMRVEYDMMLHLLRHGNGAKLDEINRMSGAQINVPGEDEVLPSGEIMITISGSEESILLAQFLIQSNIDLAMKELRDSRPVQGFQQHRGADGFNTFDQMGQPQQGPGPGHGPGPGPDQGRRWGGNPNVRPQHQQFRGGYQGGFRGGPQRGGMGRGGRGGMRGRR